MANNPAKIMKDKFGEKTKLVDAVKQFVTDDLWVGRENKDKGLARVSNAKLLRLLDTFTTVKAKWGTRASLIDAVVEAAGRTKDAGYKASMATWPVPRLYDAYNSLTKKAAGVKAAKAAKEPGAVAKKPTGKKPPTKAEAKAATRAQGKAASVNKKPGAGAPPKKSASSKTGKKG